MHVHVLAGDAVVTLEASGNALTAIPPDFLAGLPSLAHLDLSKNSLSAWPLPLSPPNCLPHLAVILLMRNRTLPALPKNAFDCCTPALTRLDLSGTLAQYVWWRQVVSCIWLCSCVVVPDRFHSHASHAATLSTVRELTCLLSHALNLSA